MLCSLITDEKNMVAAVTVTCLSWRKVAAIRGNLDVQLERDDCLYFYDIRSIWSFFLLRHLYR
jgi:hypothetical protein